jgi:hypothetical protein
MIILGLPASLTSRNRDSKAVMCFGERSYEYTIFPCFLRSTVGFIVGVPATVWVVYELYLNEKYKKKKFLLPSIQSTA